MITAEKFNSLIPLQQATLIWQEANLTAQLSDRRYAYALYQLFDFYVEIKYCKSNFVLKHMSAFSANCSHLDVYLKDIDISPLWYIS